MAPSTLLTFSIFLLCCFLCWGCGAWLAHLLVDGPRNLRWWTFALILGLGTLILTVANLNYVGIPVRTGAPVAAALQMGLSIYFCGRNSRPLLELEPRDRYALFICAMGLVLFSAPYWATGAYPFFGDSFSNCSVADFVQENGYHASPEPIHEEIWKTQIWSFVNGHFRMGVPYLLSTVSAFLGLKAYWVYVGVCCFLLFVTTMSFSVLTQTLLGPGRKSLLALGAFSCNLMMVHWSLASGFLPQTIGLGIAFLLLVTGIELGTRNRLPPWAFGFLLAMQVAFYPEMLPFMLAPLFASVFLERAKDGMQAVAATAVEAAQSLLVAALANGYNLYYAALGYVEVFRGRPMNKIGIHLDQYFTMSFGLSSVVAPPTAVLLFEIGLSVILGIICVLGWASLRGRSARLVWASLVICAPVGAYMAYSGSEYSLYKVVLYLFYLFPLGTAAGFSALWNWQKAVRMPVFALASSWILLSSYVYAVYMGTAYNVLVDPSYRSGNGNPANYMDEFTSLDGLERVTKRQGKTLLLLHDSLAGAWATYFFRAPSHMQILGVYSQMLGDRPEPPPGDFGHILVEKARTGWRKGKPPIFENNRYSLIPAQPLVSVSGEGWYQTEYLGTIPVHWMKDSAELLAFAPAPIAVQLEADTMLGPHGVPRQISIMVEGKPAGSIKVPPGKGRVRTPALSLPAGFSKIQFRSDGTTVQVGGDTRTLNVLFGEWKVTTAEAGATDTQPLTTSAPGISFTLRGSTEDHWVTDQGAFIVPDSLVPYRRLRLQIEAPGIPKLLPLNIKTTGAGNFNYTWTISKAGRYDIVIELPRPVTGELHLKPAGYFVPREIGANSDTRHLSFRVLSCTPAP
jgi:hypothetical protein